MKRNNISVIILAGIISLTACVKEKSNVIPETPTTDSTKTQAKTGNFMFHFDNMVGDKALELGSTWYTTEKGDSFTVTLFNYYISNIVFHKMDGTTYAEPESYHLVKQAQSSSQMFTIKDIPEGHYTSISYMIGVDAPKNTSGAQSGALDPANGMFWDWNSGYIMAKFEGLAPKSPNGGLKWHIGGFDGDNNVLKTVELTFQSHQIINNNNTIHLHINADLKKWFTGVHDIDLSTTYMIHMPGAKAKMIADNYANMFSLGN